MYVFCAVFLLAVTRRFFALGHRRVVRKVDLTPSSFLRSSQTFQRYLQGSLARSGTVVAHLHGQLLLPFFELGLPEPGPQTVEAACESDGPSTSPVRGAQIS